MRKLYRLLKRSPFLRTLTLLSIMVFAFYQISQRYKASPESSGSETPFFDLHPDQVASLVVSSATPQPSDLSFVRDGARWFAVSGVETVEIPVDSIIPLFNALNRMAVEEVKTGIKKMAALGIDEAAPDMKISVTQENRPVQEIYLGVSGMDAVSKNWRTCVRLPKDRVAYMVRGNLPALFNKHIDDYKNPLVLNVNPDSVVELRYTNAADSTIVFVRSNQVWSVRGSKAPVQSEALDAELRQFAHLQSRRFCSPAVAAENLPLVYRLSVFIKEGGDSIGISVFKKEPGWVIHSTQNEKAFFLADTLPVFFNNPNTFLQAQKEIYSTKTAKLN